MSRVAPGEFWTVEPLLAGQTVFCIASGPSFTLEVASRLVGQRCIVINGSCRIAAAAGLDGEILYFNDSGWFKRHRPEIDAWRGPILSVSAKAKATMPERIRRIQCQPGSGFAPGIVRVGRSAGHIAVALAPAMRAWRVVLVGYDMRPDPETGREHCHDDYVGKTRDLGIYEREFIPGFAGWDAQARAAGFEVLNATPGSALHEFRHIDLSEAL